MPLSEAKALLTRGANARKQAPLIVEEHDPNQDRLMLEELADQCELFSPHVGMESCDQPSALYLDVSMLAHLFGGEEELVAKIQQHFSEQGYLVQVALADTLGMAWGIAHYGHGIQEEGVPPQQIISSGDRQLLWALPIESLRLEQATCELLKQLGVHRVSQLAQLPRAGIATRLGDQVLRRLDQATGDLGEILVPFRKPPEFAAEIAWDTPIDDQSAIILILEQQIIRVCQQLQSRLQGAVRLDCYLHYAEHLPQRLRLELFQPTACVNHIFSLLQLQIERNSFSPGLLKVQVMTTLHAPLPVRQRELFDQPTRGDGLALAELVNRLSSRLGAEAVLEARLRSGAQPEFAFALAPVARLNRSRLRKALNKKHSSEKKRSGNENQTNSENESSTSQTEPPSLTRNISQQVSTHDTVPMDTMVKVNKVMHGLHRPLRLFRTPVPLIDPEQTPTHRPPNLFLWQGRKHRVTKRWGPERIETGWWRGPITRRDYYRVETALGERFWIFRDLQRREWFIHGEF